MESSRDIIIKFSEEINVNDKFEDIIQAFRYLRNLCAKNPEYQDEIVKSIHIIQSTKKILLKLILVKNLNDNQILCLVTGLQFLANLLVNNNKNQNCIWCSCHNLFEICLKSGYEKIQYCCLMIIYNIFLGNPEILDNISHSFECIFNLSTNENVSEYSIFIIDLFINNSYYMNNFYNDLSLNSKLVLLEETKRLCKESIINESISFGNIQFLIKLFSNKLNWILNEMKEEENQFIILEITLLLDILVACSSDDKNKFLQVFQKETSFFINCITVLKATHALSKQKNNYFSAVTKLSEIDMSETNHTNNPVLGFKSGLIRIIGNLCWKNRKFQDITRDLECLQVIMDCCVIDKNNPFIMQWSIYAIHNICENNLENKQILAGLSDKGVIDSDTLKNLGFALNKNDNKDTTLYMMPM